MSFRMMILGNESPVKLKGFNTADCFSASGMANADRIYCSIDLSSDIRCKLA